MRAFSSAITAEWSNVMVGIAPIQVAAIVITYNRKALVSKCLDAILQQSHPVTAIVLIDNGSTDGTADAVSGAGYMGSTRLHYVRLEENVGCAGGYSRGMQVAYEQGYDWLWMMDDDAIPRPQALERLLRYTATHDTSTLGGLISRPTPGSKGEQLFRLPRSLGEALRYCLFCPLDLRHGDLAPVSLDWSTFVSFLMPREVITHVGFPRSDFYIDSDDIDFTMRIREAGYSLYLIPDSLVDHLPQSLSTSASDKSPAWRYYYRYRNHIVNILTHRDLIGTNLSKMAFSRIVLGAIRRIYIFLIRERNPKAAKLVIKAVIDGYSLRMGKSDFTG
jgi:GT2 family glycosyltransferase